MVRWVLNSWSALVVGVVAGLAPGVWAAGDLDVAGQVTLRQLPSSAPVDVPLCFDATKGTLGRCFGTTDSGNIIVVSPPGTGGDFSDPIAALASIGDAAYDNPYLVYLAPGRYNIGTSLLEMKPHVHLQGAGSEVTTIWGNRLGTNQEPTMDAALAKGADDASLVDIGIQNLCATDGGFCIALFNPGTSPTLTRVNLTATGGTETYGVYNLAGAPVIRDSLVYVSGGIEVIGALDQGHNVGIFSNGGVTSIVGSEIKSEGFGVRTGVRVADGGTGFIEHSTVRAVGLPDYSHTVYLDGDPDQSFVNIFATRLDGGAVVVEGVGSPTCAATVNGTYTMLGPDCTTP